MQLILKIVIYLFLFFLSIQNTFSQDKPIIAQFNQDGALYKSSEDFSKPLAQFKEDEDCIVINYSGNYIYKIKYKEWEGFVRDEYLIINERMMDLFFAHEEKQRNNAIRKRELRQKKIQQIVNSNLDSIKKIKAQEKKQLEAIQKAKLEQQRINESRRLDSIAKVKEEQKNRKIEALKIAKEYQKLLNQQRKQDSITKAREKKKLEDMVLENTRIKQEQIKQKRREDSIAKIENLQKIRAQNIEFERLQKLKALQKTKDSIQRIREAEKKQMLAIEAAKIEEEKLVKQKKLDSIAKAENLQKIRAQNIEYERLQKLKALQKTKDSIQRIREAETKQMLAIEAAKIEAEKLAEQKKLDSIIKVQNLQKIKDSINKVKEEEKRQIELLRYTRRKQDQLLAEQKKQDSITNIREKDPKVIEEIKARNTCNYLINEYDDYYKQHIIITDKYVINENLNIELIREGSTSKIHINTREDLGCASYVPNTRSSVTITLDNGQVIKLYHSGSLDCNDFSLKAILSESKITQLKSSPIKSLTFRGTKASLIISDIDYKDFFIDKLKCIE